MSFTPPAPPWLRLPFHCYITPATAPLPTRNPGHQQNCVLRKRRQRTWRSKTSHYSSRRFSAGVCPDSDHHTRREIAWAWLCLIFFFFSFFFPFSLFADPGKKCGEQGRENRGTGEKRGWVSADSRADRDLQQTCSSGAPQEMKLHLEQGEEEVTWR